MPSRRPDLIVPIRDRRQRKRYLTLKNFGWTMAALTLLFIVITIRSEMRGLKPGEFGRLLGREIATDLEQKPVEVVREAPPQQPVDDATHADPLLVEPAARAQWLEGDVTTTVAIVPVEPVRSSSSASAVSIVGGPEGVSVVRKEARPKPVLSGGFGRE